MPDQSDLCLAHPLTKEPAFGGIQMKRHILGAMVAAAMALGPVLSAEAKTLVYCSEGSPENFNPQINTTGTSLDVAIPVFNKLVEFEPGTTKVVPGLAESYDVAEDGMSYTFH